MVSVDCETLKWGLGGLLILQMLRNMKQFSLTSAVVYFPRQVPSLSETSVKKYFSFIC